MEITADHQGPVEENPQTVGLMAEKGPIVLSAQARSYKALHVVLIKPSKFDDDGYVIRFWRGVLPSNTLSVLNGLTLALAQRGVFGELEIQVDTFDETAEKVPVERILRWSRRRGTKLVVALVGVQTNQFPRALVLAKRFRAAGIDTIMGGFHTSGTVSMLGPREPELEELYRESISVVSGEAEGRWEEILADALNGCLQPLYHYAQDLKNLVDISQVPLPVTSRKTMRHFVLSGYGTVDTSRGCPFACSFCTIINVQGRIMRERSPEVLAELLRNNYHQHGISFYFFTDDNFARKKTWRQTFETIIRLREEEGISIGFMMQVDLAKKSDDFIPLAAKAGCSQIFIGMESVNPENLKAESKEQNKVNEYKRLIREWHDQGVAVHVGYIIGLPFDTFEQLPRDVAYLMDEIQPDQASFFMLTPLPGSQDHKEMHENGEWMDPDFNKRDSFHATINHPKMSGAEWTLAYQNAWRSFYSKENMIAILKRWRHNPRVYWNVMGNFIWYKNAALIENQHPMIAGFFRFKDRGDRRPGYAVDPRRVHLWKRTRETVKLFVAWARFLKEMEEVWLATRPRGEFDERMSELQRVQAEIWRSLKVVEWQSAYARSKEALPAHARRLLDPFQELSSKILLSPRDLDAFLRKWQRLGARIHKLRKRLTRDPGPAQSTLEHLDALERQAHPSHRVREWRAAYSRLRKALPSRFPYPYARFDATKNQVVLTRQDLQAFWCRTEAQLRRGRLWSIHPWRLVVAAWRDLVLTAKFARNALGSSSTF